MSIGTSRSGFFVRAKDVATLDVGAARGPDDLSAKVRVAVQYDQRHRVSTEVRRALGDNVGE